MSLTLAARKVCPHCRVKKPRADFYACRARASGISSWCRACHASPGRRDRTRAWWAQHRRVGDSNGVYVVVPRDASPELIAAARQRVKEKREAERGVLTQAQER